VAIVAGIGLVTVWLLSTVRFVRAVGSLIGNEEDSPPPVRRSKRSRYAKLRLLVERIGVIGASLLLFLTSWIVAS